MASDNTRRGFLRSSLGASALALSSGFLGGGAGLTSAPAVAAETGTRFARVGTFINYNENPLGPCESAREALREIIAESGFYRFDLIEQLQHAVADSMGVSVNHVQLQPGSGWTLLFAPQAFTSASKSLVTADPGYEACEQQAKMSGSPVHRVALLPNGAHDIDRMCSFPDAGLIYICNPNNPTGTITPRSAIISALKKKPQGAVLMVDEAYIHYSNEQSVADLVASHPDLIVIRTFSKLYGMAGLRCGFAVAQPALLERLKRQGEDVVSVTAAVAALASLKQPDLVEQRRSYTASVRGEVLAWLRQRGVRCTDSHSNCFMMRTGRPGASEAAALAEHGVHVGRAWPSWPDWVRVSIGSREDMEAFKRAFVAAQKQPAPSNASTSTTAMRLCRAAALA
ncbi:Histidinol-phosphate aminotransferase [Carnimonas sp. R-84981]|uniref:aminotransferase class I/II-fold pyridoxal phosphate-dependent enzyme n=1 Tax=Carnimonas bestiolae TaxID=3402172 RepID=UPI003EDBB0F8